VYDMSSHDLVEDSEAAQQEWWVLGSNPGRCAHFA
jgi:hypothetical protein